MRKTALWVGIVILIIGAAAMAANQYGIADKRQVTFYNAVRVGDTLLPAGDYVVSHQMQGDEHIMVFTKTGKKVVEARVKCTLTPLSAPAVKTQIEYKMTAANEQVLTRMVFQGDRAEHRF
ncbi:MAG: hypothetical protein LAN64_03745 [Acidobacteriia bacterium]|nr:hypothetical protein [Terriglobia bacterium]